MSYPHAAFLGAQLGSSLTRSSGFTSPSSTGTPECLRALHVGAPTTVDRGKELREESPVPLESLINSISVSTHQERKRHWELAYLSHSIGGKN